MGILKAGEVESSTAAAAGRIVKLELRDFEAQAHAALDAAQREASRIVADAQAQREAIQVEACEQGRAEGFRQGFEHGSDLAREEAMERYEQELTLLMNALTSATASLDLARRQIEPAALADAVELAIAIAERVTRRRGLIDPAVLRENVRAAMQLTSRSAAGIRIAIHPSQSATLAEMRSALQMEFPQLAGAEILEDSQIDPGGCRIHTARGRIDADLKSQLDRIASKLLPQADAGAAGVGGGV